jgi:ubiquinone/menaquinone biosynthesis C-methylase UbiE
VQRKSVLQLSLEERRQGKQNGRARQYRLLVTEIPQARGKVTRLQRRRLSAGSVRCVPESALSENQRQPPRRVSMTGLTVNDEMEQWERETGVRLLIDLGIEPGQRVLDFGARVGHYSIPAARLVGDRGAVCAVDKDGEAISELKRKADASGLKNITTVRNDGMVELLFKENSFDTVLLFDVLHFFGKDERSKLYIESRRVLKPGALLLVYPKHTSEDEPSHEISNMSRDDIKQEVMNQDFTLEQQIRRLVSHDDSLNYGVILSFRKR